MTEINYADVFMRVDIELRKKGQNRTALASIGVSGSSVSNWARGERIPNCTAIAKIAEYLNVSMEWLLFGREKNGDLSAEERELVEAYRQLSVQSRAVVLTAAKGLRQG